MKDGKLSGARDRNVTREEDSEIDLMELLRTLWRGKLWIALCALVALFIGGYYAFVSAVPVYTSTSVVMLESRQEQVVELENVLSGLSGDQATINTEIEVIRSRGLIEKLVHRLDLIADPEFNAALRPAPAFSLGKAIASLRGLFGTGAQSAPSGEHVILNRVIDNVTRALSVSNIRQSYVFQITAITEDPVKSAALANTLAELYILEQIEVKFAATEQATEWLSGRVSELQVELEKSVEALKGFNTGADLISPETLVGLNRQLKESRDRLREVQASRITAEARLQGLESAGASGSLAQMAEIARDTTLNRLMTLPGEVNRAAFEARFTQILERTKLDITRADSQISALGSSIQTQEEQIARQSADLVKLQQLEREAEANRLIYEYFLNRLKETSIQKGIQQADSRMLSNAVVPLNPSAPRKPMVLALSLILGTLAGTALVLGHEFSQNTYRLAEDLEARTGYTVLGQIPAIPARQRKNVLKYLSDKPTSAAAEAIRNLRTSLLLSDLDNPPQIIMSTSSIPGEGKTTQSLALTRNLAEMGNKVLLIEGDMRRRIFTEYFEIKDRKGLMALLTEEMPLQDIARQEPMLKADLIIADKTSANAADIFSSERFRNLLKELRGTYDYIIIDTPPVLAVPDARIIGQAVDAILYTVKWDSTSKRQVAEGIKSFENVNLKVTGLALAQISPKGMKKYGYGDSYGAYDQYYQN